MTDLWNRISALAWHSLTVAWGYALIVAGVALDVLPFVSDLLGTAEVQSLITAYGGIWGPHLLKLGGLITVMVRLRTLKGT